MAGMLPGRRVLKLAVIATLAVLTSATAHAQYSNRTAIAVPAPGSVNETGIGAPYPSQIVVADLLGTVQRVTVNVSRITHDAPDDLELIVAAPSGQRTTLMDGACGLDPSGAGTFSLTFDDAAAFPLPDAGCVSTVYKPSPGALSALTGGPPSGTWQLFARDRGLGDAGAITGGWRINLTLAGFCAGEQATAVEHEPVRTGTSKHIVTGTDGPDVLLGTDGEDSIKGLGGDDLICGGGGKDKIRGGSGDDVLRGEDGRDSANGQGGNDELFGGRARDDLVGESGNDKLKGQDGKDSCRGGGGRDRARSCEKEKSL